MRGVRKGRLGTNEEAASQSRCKMELQWKVIVE